MAGQIAIQFSRGSNTAHGAYVGGRLIYVAASHFQEPTCGGGYEARSARKRQRRCEVAPLIGGVMDTAKIGNCHTFSTPVEC